MDKNLIALDVPRWLCTINFVWPPLLLLSSSFPLILGQEFFKTHIYLIFEVGCLGWIPPRFFSLMRKLGFDSKETCSMHDSIQLIARKCSYVIWLNRFNKDFSTIRILTRLVLFRKPLVD